MLTVRHESLQWKNNTETTRNQESTQSQIKLPVFFYKVYFLRKSIKKKKF